MVKGDAGSISHVDGQRVHRKSILKINFGENPENKIEGTPILKFAMIKRLQVEKIHQEICRKNFEIFIEKIVKFVEKIL